MRKILFILIFTFTQYSISQEAQFHDAKALMTFEKVDIKAKLITFSGRQYSYKMLDIEDSYFNETNYSRSLNDLRKGDKLYVTIRVLNSSLKHNKSLKLKEFVIIVSKNRDAI